MYLQFTLCLFDCLGQVTYRVVQVAQDGGEAQVVTSTAFPPGTQVTQVTTVHIQSSTIAHMSLFT